VPVELRFDGLDRVQQGLMMVVMAVMRMRESRVFVGIRCRRMIIAMRDMLFVPVDFSFVRENPGLVRQDFRLGSFQDGERVQVFLAPPEVILTMVEMLRVCVLIRSAHGAYAPR